MKTVNVFVSSTCYDLAQIRTDLKEFILSLGHNPILSEEYNFPINPQKGTVDNCIDAVRKYADIFVLIVGNRYGSQLDNGKSITNTEFSTAIEKNIPIYTFTLNSLIHILPVWQDNKSGDYSRQVDNQKIFEFVEEVRSKDYWNFGFDTAQDITRTLKNQWSNLFNNALYYRGIFNRNEEYKSLYRNISTDALKIIFEKKYGFEPGFFLQCCTDEIEKYESLKNDYTYSIILQVPLGVNSTIEFADWANLRLAEMETIINSFNSLMKNAFTHYFGVQGTPSDLNGLYYIAKTYGRIYSAILNWSIDIRSLSVEDSYVDCRNALADISKLIIPEMETYPIKSLKQIEEAKERDKKGEENTTINTSINLDIDEDAANGFRSEMRKL